MNNRIDLGDLKSQIVKRVGPDRAQQYFGYLNQLLSQKLSKPEFNKLCVWTLGRENLRLHNQLIKSVLRNACLAKTPLPELKKAPHPPTWSNGDALPQAPLLSRSSVGGRRIKDRPSPLGPNGRAEAPHDETIHENGVLSSCDLKRPVQHHEGALPEPLAKRPRLAESLSMCLVEAVNVERERDYPGLAKVPLQAPLGIPFCPPSIGGARKYLPSAASSFGNSGSCSDSGELMHNDDLRRRMERIAQGQGLGGIALDCANLLNNGLNSYLKRLIKSSLDLVRTRSGQTKQQPYKHQIQGKPINGIWQGNHVCLESPTDLLDRRLLTMQDFRVAMELNPQQLGENWPLLLEKFSHHSFEE